MKRLGVLLLALCLVSVFAAGQAPNKMYLSIDQIELSDEGIVISFEDSEGNWMRVPTADLRHDSSGFYVLAVGRISAAGRIGPIVKICLNGHMSHCDICGCCSVRDCWYRCRGHGR